MNILDTWEGIWRSNEIVWSKNSWRFENLIAKLTPYCKNVYPGEVRASGWEEFDLHLKIIITVEEGVCEIY